MSVERPVKRVRQACEPCRRKKSRCLGERPTCSHCSRLRQPCVYADEIRYSEATPSGGVVLISAPRPSSDEVALEGRLKSVEARLGEVLANQATLARSVSQSFSSSPSFSAAKTSRPQNITRTSRPLPSWDTVVAAAQTYLIYCDCQPLPLFHRGTFIESLDSRQPELLYAILELCSRFDRPSHEPPAELQGGYAGASRSLVMASIIDGCVELSTLQSLCLLTLIDFSNGNTRRASMHSSLGMSLALAAGLASELSNDLSIAEREERRRCFWSLFLLKRIHGADFGTLDFADEENFPWYPETTGVNNSQNSDRNTTTSTDGSQDKGIVAYAIQLSEVWFKITRYARRRGKPTSLPPWAPQSEYATIMAQQMESETRMPYIHRFKPSNFLNKTAHELQANRDYWAPWLFVQILYHTNLCLLNHPLLLSLRLRNFKSMIPEIFLQHTSDIISSHSNWIIHLIGIIEAKQFKVTDPFLGHCVAIVATIYLQESFVEDITIRGEKQEKFMKCLNFVRGFGKQWPHVARIADKLQCLGETVSSTCETNDGLPQNPNRSLLIDLGQFWEILEYGSSSEVPGAANGLFGASLSIGFAKSSTEISTASALPLPTRVESQSSSRQQFCPANADQLFPPPVPLLYSDDELAVLAESFFQQRSEMEDGVDEWWRIGNL